MTFHDPNFANFTYGSNPSRKTKEELISSHMPLVRKLAWHVHGSVSSAIEVEDLIQIGTVALVEAAQNFEDRGLGFSNYAKLRVRGAMIDHLRKISSLSRSATKFRRSLQQIKSKLALELGGEPNEKELATAMNMDAESFRLAVDQAESVELKSMDEVYSDQNIWFMDQAEQADDALERVQMQENMAAAIAQLPEREAMVLKLYFVEEMNLDEIGKTMDIGAARVCQIKKTALEKLKGLIKDGPLL